MGSGEEAELESRRAGNARASVRAADRTCVAQRNRLGDGDDDARRLAAYWWPRRVRLLAAFSRGAATRARRSWGGARRGPRWRLTRTTMLSCSSRTLRCASGHLHLWGGYTSVAESLLVLRAPSVVRLGQRCSSWSLRASLLHAAPAEQPPCLELAHALAWIAQVQLRR